MKKLMMWIFPPLRKVVLRLKSIERLLKVTDRRVRNVEQCVDFLIKSPEYKSEEKTGFGGQMMRRKLFGEIVSILDFQCAIETGTWMGNTAGYLSEMINSPVYTCEIDKRYYALAKLRLKGIGSISFYQLDSRAFLKGLIQSEPTRRIVDSNTFFYLDAHWYSDVPLRAEIDIIFSKWREFVIMVDDFEVPYDNGFGFDDYGDVGRLTIELIRDLVAAETSISVFFPAYSSLDETGAKRGWVLLATETNSKVLREISMLKEYSAI